MIKVLRQYNLILGEGDLDEGSEVNNPAWRGLDVSDKYKLLVEQGQITGGYYQIAGSTSQTVALPEAYDVAERLCTLITAYGQVRVAIVHPVRGTSTFTLNGSADSPASYACNGLVTSITITTPTATAVKVRYTLYEQPDLTSMDSYYGGVYNYGVLT